MGIPGVKTLIRDRFYSVSRQDAPAGPRIVAIAKRSTANLTGGVADLDVVRVSNEADVITAFGDGSDAHRAFLELLIAGAGRMYIVPLPSDTIFVPSTGAVTSSAVDIFDDAFIAAESCVPDIIVPWGRGGRPSEWAATPDSPNDSTFGFYANNSATVASNWAYKVSAKVKDISENINPCIAVMGVKPFTGASETMTPGNVNSHLALSGLPVRNDIALLK